MNFLSLFAGIGGFDLGLERAGMTCVAQCEIDEPCRKVLKKHWPDIPIYEDVRTLTGEQLEKDGITDIGLICGGYPCQPFSTAGKRKGAEDDRHLWPEYFRLIREIRPNWVIGENVAGHINMGLESVLADLEGEGYQSQVFLIPACALGAPHRRDRVWIVARDSESDERYQKRGIQEGENTHTRRICENVGNTRGDKSRRVSGKRREEILSPRISSQDVAHSELTGSGEDNARSNQRRSQTEPETLQQENGKTHASDTGEGGRTLADSAHSGSRASGSKTDRNRKAQNERWSGQPQSEFNRFCWWDIEPAMGRVANGVPGRVDRLRQLGNAIVPQIPEIIGRAIMDIVKHRERH